MWYSQRTLPPYSNTVYTKHEIRSSASPAARARSPVAFWLSSDLTLRRMRLSSASERVCHAALKGSSSSFDGSSVTSKVSPSTNSSEMPLGASLSAAHFHLRPCDYVRGTGTVRSCRYFDTTLAMAVVSPEDSMTRRATLTAVLFALVKFVLGLYLGRSGRLQRMEQPVR